MHFADFSPYRYLTRTDVTAAHNIGWIEELSQLRIGVIDSLVPDLLERHYLDLVGNQTRGYHDCALCDETEIWIASGDQRIVLGAAELWIPDGDGDIFVAPDLVIHYIRAHLYRPADRFVSAVLRLPTTIPGWNGEHVAERLCARQT